MNGLNTTKKMLLEGFLPVPFFQLGQLQICVTRFRVSRTFFPCSNTPMTKSSLPLPVLFQKPLPSFSVKWLSCPKFTTKPWTSSLSNTAKHIGVRSLTAIITPNLPLSKRNWSLTRETCGSTHCYSEFRVNNARKLWLQASPKTRGANQFQMQLTVITRTFQPVYHTKNVLHAAWNQRYTKWHSKNLVLVTTQKTTPVNVVS